MKDVECLVLDMDDTLFLERDYVRSGFQHVGRVLEQRHGVEGFLDVAWKEFESGRRGDIFDVALTRLGCAMNPGLIGELVESYRTHAPEITLLPDATAFLSGHRCAAVITDGPVDSQRRKADKLGLPAQVNHVILTAAYGQAFHKPSPAAFDMVQRLCGVAAARCCYVGDNPAKDFRGPKSLGWQTVRIRRPQGLHHHVASDADVDLEIEDFSALGALLPAC
jgi:putative hydrolase of the HAD superfamily